jgi:hypothetical protein
MDRFSQGIAGKTGGKDIVSGQNIVLSNSLTIPAKTFMLIELK